MKEIVYKLSDLPAVVQQLRPLIDRASVVTFTGQLGAGKTTLVQEILKSYGVSEDAQSPTFTYLHQFRPHGEREINHFDLYRLESLDDFYLKGFDEYLYAPNSLCLIEWPSVIDSLLRSAVCNITIDHVNDEERRLTVQCID